MKTIGIIGGMSWQSTAEYYRLLNEFTKQELGGFHSCKCIINSLDFAQIESLQHKGDWNSLTKIMINTAISLEKAGAELLIISTNTMHKMAGDIERTINIPLLHIADATARAIKEQKISKVALLGTKFTMEQDFYKQRITNKFGIDLIIPDEKARNIVHDVIYKELVMGIINMESQEKFKSIIKELGNRGAEGVILGCTEIPLLIKQDNSELILFDTTKIHSKYAIQIALE